MGSLLLMFAGKWFFTYLGDFEAFGPIAQTKLVLVLVARFQGTSPQGSWEEDRGKSKTYF